MADTLGSLIDKLFTVDTKMWTNQELLYEIRRMSFEDFVVKYRSESGMRELWATLQKACDLNVQRNDLIDEIDQKIVEISVKAAAGYDLGAFIQRKHKTY